MREHLTNAERALQQKEPKNTLSYQRISTNKNR
jgi:hypothetical protein